MAEKDNDTTPQDSFEQMVEQARNAAAALQPPWSEWLEIDIELRNREVPDTNEHLLAGMKMLQPIATHLSASIDVYKLQAEIVKQLQQAAERELFNLQAQQADTSSVQRRLEHLGQRLENINQWQAKIESVLVGARQFSCDFERRLAAIAPARFIAVRAGGSGKPN